MSNSTLINSCDGDEYEEVFDPIPLEILKTMQPTPAQKAAPGLDKFEEWMRSHEQEEGSVGPAEPS